MGFLSLTKSASVLIFGIIDLNNAKESELKEIIKSEHIGFNLTNGFVVENMEAYYE